MRETITSASVVPVVKKAAEAVMRIYNSPFDIAHKKDGSPLTHADTMANRILCEGLETLFPNIPILSEESSSVSYESRKNWHRYWCIDPIDGTKEFIAKNGQFTINVALIEKGIPVLGVVFAPALHLLYRADMDNGAFKNERPIQPIDKKCLSHETVSVVASKSHFSEETEKILAILQKRTGKPLKTLAIGSSLKLLEVAEGTADIYPRLAPTMEWDTAAADAIVRLCGKHVFSYPSNALSAEKIPCLDDGFEPLSYNKRDLRNPWFVVV